MTASTWKLNEKLERISLKLNKINKGNSDNQKIIQHTYKILIIVS